MTLPGFTGRVPTQQQFLGTGDKRREIWVFQVCLLPFHKCTSKWLHPSILTAREECQLVHQKTWNATFDQPLFWKACDLVASVPEFSNVVVIGGGGSPPNVIHGCHRDHYGWKWFERAVLGDFLQATVLIRICLDMLMPSRAVRAHSLA